MNTERRLSVSKELFEPLSAYGELGWKGRWHENHGNWLLVFSGLVCLAGFGWIAFSDPANPSVSPGKPTLQFPVDRDGQIIIPPPETTAVIRILGANITEGVIRAAVYESPETFQKPELAVVSETLAVNDEGFSILPLTVSELPERIAIAAYYDANNDGTLNRNLLGIPTEPYGFSNRARNMIGPPKFEDAVFDRPDPGTVVDLLIW
jgi:uncharacterized protein (DUF2141 family)